MRKIRRKIYFLLLAAMLAGTTPALATEPTTSTLTAEPTAPAIAAEPATPALTATPATQAVTVQLNGVIMPWQGRIIDDRTVVPLRALATTLGLAVEWHEREQKIILRDPKTTIQLQIGQYFANVNGHRSLLTVPPQIIEDQTYIPLRFITQNLHTHAVWDAATSTVFLTTVTENPVTIEPVTDDMEGPPAKVEIQYPRLRGLADQAIEAKLNQQIRDRVMEFKKATLAQAEENRQELSAYPDAPIDRFYIGSNYEITFNQADLLSIRFTDATYFGGAHGMHYLRSLTANLKTGQIYQLDDLFRHKDYQAPINQAIMAQNKERDWPFDPPFLSIDDQQEFYLSPDGIVIYFQVYRYTPYAVGAPEFTIPYKDLHHLLAL
ncbi:stalk domain-containing protein [Heliophilum fasciatum]|uniref:Uncharacterized protein DUF4163 n=1 Tax=Heliophilum fasciatum TaxID=35700 RepID=A0A4R2RIC7_9FIRM|nr:stalk domain-containing protein [Heliophilum fasciatum]MCW2278777.1 hypothetical protein [Heliophilum fasciatum]TCP62448.1 uncharacterized protein DUF4163 [Heliophilum fasciatum]